MYIPKTMIKKISDAFYDKDIEVLDRKIIVDDEGGVKNSGFISKDTFKGNVSFSNGKKIQEDYGLNYNVDIAVTTYVDTEVLINDFIRYDNIVYNVVDVLKSDSHILITGTKWQQ